MKKNLFFLSIIPLLLLCVFFGCKFAESEDLLSAPSVEVSSLKKGIIISRERLSDSTAHVNIYRLNVSTDKVVHIGTIYPEYVSGSILTFDDVMVYDNIAYKYKMVYVDADGSKYATEWSSSKKAESDLKDTGTTFAYNTASSVLIYNLTEQTLRLDSAITVPDSSDDTSIDARLAEYSPAIVLETSSEAKAFSIDSVAADTKLLLNNVLPASFYDTPVSVAAIVGKYEEKDSENEDANVVRIYWYEPAEIQVNQAVTVDGIETVTKVDISSFTIASKVSDGGIEY